MRFTQDAPSNVNVVRSYGPGEIRVNDGVYHQSVIVGPDAVCSIPQLRDVADLTMAHVAQILAWQPELVLVGTGARQTFPAADITARFMSAGVGVEVMDTGAACRTLNVLVSEQRRAAAILILGT